MRKKVNKKVIKEMNNNKIKSINKVRNNLLNKKNFKIIKHKKKLQKIQGVKYFKRNLKRNQKFLKVMFPKVKLFLKKKHILKYTQDKIR